jgi:hypothetical protein
MKAAPEKKLLIRIAVVGSDHLQFVGLRAVFDSERDFELTSSSLSDVGTQQEIDLVLLRDRSGQNLFDVMASLKATRPLVSRGSVGAPRRVLSVFIERVSRSSGRIFPAGRVTFTDREREVLELLVGGRSNKEIGALLPF